MAGSMYYLLRIALGDALDMGAWIGLEVLGG